MTGISWQSLVLSVAILLCPFSVSAMEPELVYIQNLPLPTGIQPPNDPSISGPQLRAVGWYRWTMPADFTIHAYDKAQGQYLFDNIVQMKTWCLERWGLADQQFSPPCQVYCAPDAATMKKLFNLSGSYGEIRNGQALLWLVLDAKPTESVPPALSVLLLKQMEGVGFWAQRGIPILNMTLPQIRRYIVELSPNLQQDSPIYFSQALLQMTETEYKKLPPEKQKLFDSEAAMFCLFVRKEFGQKNFQSMLGAGSQGVTNVLGFRDFAHLDSAFKRYLFYIVKDVRENKTPDHYLQIEQVK